jgi:hypothetical protein
MILTNAEIVNYFTKLDAVISELENDMYCTPRIRYAIAKNLTLLAPTVSIINNIKNDIYRHYGTLVTTENDEEVYQFDDNVLTEVNKNLEELSVIENNVDIITLSLSDIESLDLSLKQMEALMFMIKE